MHGDDQPAVRLIGVGKHYRHFDLEDIDLELPAGLVLGLIGPNGAGKSTILRMLIGLVRPDRGEVYVLGLPMPRTERIVKGRVGFVSEDMSPYGSATLRYHMDLVRRLSPTWDEGHARDLARRFDLRPEQRLRGMSRGQCVKALLLLALARRPALLVLDEPTAGLDPVARAELLRELRLVARASGQSVLFSSHNTHDVEDLSDRVCFLYGGRILEAGDKGSFVARWRELTLELPSPGWAPPPGVTLTARSGTSVAAVTDRFGPDVAGMLAQTGARVVATRPLSLEEIFLARVAGAERRAA